MNAPFKPERTSAVGEVLATAVVGISELKKNPAAVITEAQSRQVAILNRNRPVAYVISPAVWEYMCDLVLDLRVEEEAREELERDEEGVEIDLEQYL